MEKFKFFDNAPMWVMIVALILIIALWVLSFKPLYSSYNNGVLSIEPISGETTPLSVAPEIKKPN